MTSNSPAEEQPRLLQIYLKRCNERNRTRKNFRCYENVVSMITKANLLNPVDLPSMNIKFYNVIFFSLPGMFTGVQGDIRCKVLATLSTVK